MLCNNYNLDNSSNQANYNYNINQSQIVSNSELEAYFEVWFSIQLWQQVIVCNNCHFIVLDITAYTINEREVEPVKRKKHCLNELTNDSCHLKKKSRNRFWKISSIQWEFTGFQKQNYKGFIKSCLFSSLSAAYLQIFSEELTESTMKIWEMSLGGMTEVPWFPCTSKCIRIKTYHQEPF